MKTLLILGGSQQIGRRLIEKLLEGEINQYHIYTFNRGLTNPTLFQHQKVSKIIGDRNTDDIKQIFNQNWDVILDCSCYDPISFKKLLQGIKGRVGRYVFISTISVYDYKKNIGKNEPIHENFELVDFTEEQIREKGFNFYAEKKIAAEKYLLNSGLDALIFRPHFIYGKYDWQNLDYYWINRIKNYEHILVPGGKDIIHRTYIDNLVTILLNSFNIEQHQQIYNVVTHNPLSVNDYLFQLAKILKKEIAFTSVAPEKLLKLNIRPIIDIPLWSNGSHFVFSADKLRRDFQVNFQSHYQSLVETCEWNEQIKYWKKGKSKWENGKLGLDREKEMMIINSL